MLISFESTGRGFEPYIRNSRAISKEQNNFTLSLLFQCKCPPISFCAEIVRNLDLILMFSAQSRAGVTLPLCIITLASFAQSSRPITIALIYSLNKGLMYQYLVLDLSYSAHYFPASFVTSSALFYFDSSSTYPNFFFLRFTAASRVGKQRGTGTSAGVRSSLLVAYCVPITRDSDELSYTTCEMHTGIVMSALEFLKCNDCSVHSACDNSSLAVSV